MDVVVADDHDVVAVGFASAAHASNGTPSVRVRGQARDTDALWAVLARTSCDVVVLDLSLGDGVDPADTVRALAAAGHRVVVYTAPDGESHVTRALRAGALAASRKSDPVEVTLDTIRQVATNQTVLAPDWVAAEEVGRGSARLSSREREVLRLYVEGMEVAQIAQELFVTENSAKEYLRRVRAKYAAVHRPAPTKVDLLRRAIEDGVVPPIRPI